MSSKWPRAFFMTSMAPALNISYGCMWMWQSVISILSNVPIPRSGRGSPIAARMSKYTRGGMGSCYLAVGTWYLVVGTWLRRRPSTRQAKYELVNECHPEPEGRRICSAVSSSESRNDAHARWSVECPKATQLCASRGVSGADPSPSAQDDTL